MKKIAIFVAASSLLFGIVACDNNARTSTNAPDTVTGTGAPLTTENQKENKEDATSEIRKKQLNADIRAREQRNDIAGNQQKRADGDIESEVRSKLEANIPGGQLTVNSKNGAVAVAGTVVTTDQIAKIEPLAKQILGVKTVAVNVKVGK